MEPLSDTLNLKPGDPVECKVVAVEPGGYLVTLIPSAVQGFLPSHESFLPGFIVSSTFICMSGDKALLGYPKAAAELKPPSTLSGSDSAMAFARWAESRPVIRRVQRAIDLFMPPLAALPTCKRLSPDEVERRIAKWERDDFTGCLKVDSAVQRSRSAVLFYRGRAVGAIYGKKSLSDGYRIETSLLLMLEDMRHSVTEVEYYSLPDEFVLALSAMFLGVILERPYGFKNPEYARSILKQFREHNSTGCLSLQQHVPCGLGLISKGKFAGSYVVDAQVFRTQESSLDDLFERFPAGRLEAFILPDIMMSDAMQFGYSLSSAPFGA